MAHDTSIHQITQAQTTQDPPREVLRDGAKKMLIAALESEYVEQFAAERDSNGQRMVVRNGRCPERSIQTALGPIPVARPGIDDRRPHEDGTRYRCTRQVVPRTYAKPVPWRASVLSNPQHPVDALLSNLLGSDRQPRWPKPLGPLGIECSPAVRIPFCALTTVPVSLAAECPSLRPACRHAGGGGRGNLIGFQRAKPRGSRPAPANGCRQIQS